MFFRSLSRASAFLSFASASLLTVAFAPGCSPEVRNFGNSGGAGGTGGAGGDTSTSSSTTTTTGTGGQMGVGGSGGAGGSAPATCMPGQPPYAGPICGSDAMPCKVLADEMVVPDPSFRNDAPAIAIDAYCTPSIASSVAVGGFHGFVSHRTGDDKWMTEPETPFPLARAGIAKTPDGRLYVLAYGGNSMSTLFTQVQGQWDMGAQMPGALSVTAPGFYADGQGVLHAASSDSNKNILHGTFGPNGWSVAQVATASGLSGRIPLGLSPNGDAHMIYWASGTNGWNLYWVSPPIKAELAAPLGSNSLGSESQNQAIAVTPANAQNPNGQPHILFARPLPNTQDMELAYATRQGAWNVLSVVQEDPALKQSCGSVPMQAGLTCDFSDDSLWPLAVVASEGGDVRMIYARIHTVQKRVSVCPGGPQCFWDTQSDMSDGQIHMAWFDGGTQAKTAVVATNILTRMATAVLDPIGRIHIAAYDYPPGGGDTRVRYLLIGP